MLEQILQHDDVFQAPEALMAQATLQDFDAEYARSIADPDAFWGEWAQRFEWFKPWDKVMEWITRTIAGLWAARPTSRSTRWTATPTAQTAPGWP